MADGGSFKLGIKKLPGKFKDGLPAYDVRLLAPHPDRPGQKLVDSVRRVGAKSKSDAMRQQQELTAAELAAKLGASRRGAPRTFAEVGAEWIATIDRHGTIMTWGSFLRKLSAEFGEMRMDKIRVDHMQRFIAQLRSPKTGKPYERPTMKGIRTVLVKVFDHALTEGDLTGENPASGVKLKRPVKSGVATLATLRGTAPVKKGLDRVELPIFMSAFQQHYPDYYLLVLLMVVTGSRFAEMSALERDSVNMLTGEIYIFQGQVSGRLGPTKKDKARVAALPVALIHDLHVHLAQMDRLRWEGFERYIFPARYTRKRKFEPLMSRSEVGKAIKAVMAMIGVSTVTATHFARHTLNGLIRGHVASDVLRSVVGHSSEEQSVAYGDPRVLEFAESVGRVLLSAGGSDRGTDNEESEK